MERLELLSQVGPEALAFGYTITAATSLWTCLAVVTAAFGFWRIRALAAVPKPATTPPRAPPATGMVGEFFRPPELGSGSPSGSAADSQPEITQPRDADAKPGCRVAVCHKSAVFEAFDCSWCPQEEEERGHGGAESGWVDDGEEGERATATATTTLLTGRGDLGWYRCLDPTAINGNVVRLWEDDCRRRTWPSRRLLRWSTM